MYEIARRTLDCRIRLAASLAALVALASACQTSGVEEPPILDTSPPAAEVDGDTISVDELDEWIRGELYRRETQGNVPAKVYELRSRELQNMLTQRVIDAAAESRQLTVDELIEAEVAKLDPVSDDDVAEFYAQNQSRMGGAKFEAVAPQIRPYLEAQRRNDAVRALVEAAEIEILLEPVRHTVAATGPSKGPENAPVTIIEFSDFQCPFCQRAVPIMKEVLDAYPDSVRLVYRHLPLGSHSRAHPAAIAAVCADRQGRFWPYHDLLFANNRALDDDDLLAYAEQVGADLEPFGACLADPAVSAKVDGDATAAREAGISSTPTFLVNGVPISGAQPVEAFRKTIDEELRRLSGD